eukprot:TRINITY_DN1083_c0_g1_i2.p1 TRINITY_DN1083_c0_g1~~TRINITY_DN1083_c0_g1_i2.p1  ORF type:complete len:128 (+),score=27.65 TRINITY_DN1083_c0_g1_i2:299-682(+)
MFSLRRISSVLAPASRITFSYVNSPIRPTVNVLSTKRFFSAGPAPLTEPEIQERVLHVVRTFEKVDGKKLELNSSFSHDLGLDSLDSVEVVMAIEEEFGIEIPDADAEGIKTPSDAVVYIKKNPHAK